jgi:metal-responsive CopG/Arc/MetJ family transcriptional regulator
MARARGRMMWVPKIVITELDSIKVERDIESNSEAFRQLVKSSRVARKVPQKPRKRRSNDLDLFGLGGGFL